MATSWNLESVHLTHNPHRLVMSIHIQDSTFTTIIVEPTLDPNDLTKYENRLFSGWNHNSDDTVDRERDAIVDQVLQLGQERYGQLLPQFFNSLFVRTGQNGIELVEEMDHLMLAVLKHSGDTFGYELALPPLIPRTALLSQHKQGHFFLPQTRLVEFKGRLFVAKGPAQPERAMSDFAEVKHLITLPHKHPNIIPLPFALITLSEVDLRICGFLVPFYENGNLDCYAQKLRMQSRLTEQLLWKWGSQLVSAVRFLIGAKTWHGDIKPDNILVSNNEDIVLIDFTREFATHVTASPEVLEQWSVVQDPSGTLIYEAKARSNLEQPKFLGLL